MGEEEHNRKKKVIEKDKTGHSRGQSSEDLSLVFLDDVQSIDIKHPVRVHRYQDASRIRLLIKLLLRPAFLKPVPL